MNQINPKKLLHTKWTAVQPRNKEKHFIVTEVEFDEEGVAVLSCVLEAVMTRRSARIEWRVLADSRHLAPRLALAAARQPPRNPLARRRGAGVHQPYSEPADVREQLRPRDGVEPPHVAVRALECTARAVRDGVLDALGAGVVHQPHAVRDADDSGTCRAPRLAGCSCVRARVATGAADGRVFEPHASLVSVRVVTGRLARRHRQRIGPSSDGLDVRRRQLGPAHPRREDVPHDGLEVRPRSVPVERRRREQAAAQVVRTTRQGPVEHPNLAVVPAFSMTRGAGDLRVGALVEQVVSRVLPVHTVEVQSTAVRADQLPRVTALDPHAARRGGHRDHLSAVVERQVRRCLEDLVVRADAEGGAAAHLVRAFEDVGR
ncbi:MAG: TIGR02450 family Trp-rich protein [Sandaracinaceae bacterium]|nr:TIGR02450 family Trp-rich protein [Sandaracinaceae bacterium]